MAERGSKDSKWVLLALIALLGYGAYQWLPERSPDTPATQAAAPSPAPPAPASTPPAAPPPPPPAESVPVVAPPPALAPTWQPPVLPPVQQAHAPPPAPAPQVAPKLEPSIPWIEAPAAAHVGEHVVVTVNIDSKSAQLNSILLRVRYDVTRLSLQSVSVGDFMMQTGVPGNFASDDNPGGGEVAVSLLAEAGQAAIGRGSVAVFGFEAIDEGNAVVELEGVEAHEASGRPVEVVNTAPQSISIDP